MLHKIAIRYALNGYIAEVGCQTLVFNSRADMLAELGNYLEKPDETEKRFREKSINAKHLSPAAPEPNTYTAVGNTLTFISGTPTTVAGVNVATPNSLSL